MPSTRKSHSTKAWEHVFDEELAELRPRSQHGQPAPSGRTQNTNDLKQRLTGIALSGGGIRSASFSLGVVQALLKFNVLKRLHYMSTVSGGGYTGIAISWLRKLYKRDEQYKWESQITGVVDDSKKKRGARDRFRRNQEKSEPEAKGVWLDYIRQHVNYLEPPRMGKMGLVSVALRNLTLSIGVYVVLLSLLLYVLTKVRVYGTPAVLFDTYKDFSWSFFSPLVYYDVGSLTLAMLVFVILTFILYSLGSWVTTTNRYIEPIALLLLIAVASIPVVIGLRPNFEPLCASCEWRWGYWTSALLLAGSYCLAFTIAFALKRIVFRGTPTNDDDLYEIRVSMQKYGGELSLSIASTLGLLTLISYAPVLLNSRSISWSNTTISTLGLVAIVATTYGTIARSQSALPRRALMRFIILVTFSIAVVLGLASAHMLSALMVPLPKKIVLLITAITLIVALFTDLNQFGIGRMYRDRLMETFMPDKESIESTKWKKAKMANEEGGLLANLWTRPIDDGSEGYLYPLINTNVVLIDSDEDTYRGRGGDSFVLSPLFCGSDATKWIETDHFADGDVKAGTAMAISGAAANPNAAPGGHGFSRNRLVSFLMFLAQARLGAWVRNPNRPQTFWVKLAARLRPNSPNFIHPGLSAGLFGKGLHEQAHYLELTDGGHFENTGVYELVRRRAKLIILSQASQDSDFGFADLANLVEKIRVDFGVRLSFLEGMSLSDVIPSISDASDRLPMANRGYAIAKIEYDELFTGWLVYFQASPLRDVPVDVNSYYYHNRDFPNEPTANQFFREAQLEAYRELGYTIAKSFLAQVLESRSAGATLSTSTGMELNCLQEIDKLLSPEERA